MAKQDILSELRNTAGVSLRDTPTYTTGGYSFGLSPISHLTDLGYVSRPAVSTTATTQQPTKPAPKPQVKDVPVLADVPVKTNPTASQLGLNYTPPSTIPGYYQANPDLIPVSRREAAPAPKSAPYVPNHPNANKTIWQAMADGFKYYDQAEREGRLWETLFPPSTELPVEGPKTEAELQEAAKRTLGIKGTESEAITDADMKGRSTFMDWIRQKEEPAIPQMMGANTYNVPPTPFTGEALREAARGTSSIPATNPSTVTDSDMAGRSTLMDWINGKLDEPEVVEPSVPNIPTKSLYDLAQMPKQDTITDADMVGRTTLMDQMRSNTSEPSRPVVTPKSLYELGQTPTDSVITDADMQGRQTLRDQLSKLPSLPYTPSTLAGSGSAYAAEPLTPTDTFIPESVQSLFRSAVTPNDVVWGNESFSPSDLSRLDELALMRARQGHPDVNYDAYGSDIAVGTNDANTLSGITDNAYQDLATTLGRYQILGDTQDNVWLGDQYDVTHPNPNLAAAEDGTTAEKLAAIRKYMGNLKASGQEPTAWSYLRAYTSLFGDNQKTDNPIRLNRGNYKEFGLTKQEYDRLRKLEDYNKALGLDI